MHKLLAKEPGKAMLLLGNEALARGALEAGVGFASTYPGTPSSELSLNFFQISRETDLYFEYSTNEKVALEVAAAAANCGVRSMCVMKHVGVNVAADALMTLAYVGVKAGMVLVSADDPHMFSSQNEQDNRYYGKLSGLPVIEPSSVAEAKEMAVYAFELSEALGEPVILRTTTRVNHSSAKVVMGKLPETVTVRGRFEKDPFNYVTVPAVSRRLHVRLLERLKKAAGLSNASPYNIRQGNGRYGIICNGVSWLYVTDALKALGRESDFSVLRIGFSNPMPDAVIKAFLADCDKVLIAEEGEPFMEEAVKAMAAEEKRCIEIVGKRDDLFSRLSEFDPQMVARCIARCFDIPYMPPAPVDLTGVPEIPQRPPNLCPGCSHRATFYAVKKATEGYETIFPTDIGCYTLGFLPPLSMGDFLICMGSSVGTACGFSRASNQKVVAFIGDSTFFHSGIPALINGVFNNHDFTLVILDNGTTAMTGHQPHPGVDMDELNFPGFHRVSIEALVKGIGVGHVSVIRPYNLKKSIEAIREAVEFKGVSVVIAREECVLKAKSLKRSSNRVFYVSDRCKNHRDCINTLACPAFYVEAGRVRINPDLCAGCAVCVQVCPEKAIVPVKD
ncbi:MAG: indolepyruvate ferredoxin oxidoreductase subunit alpha [Thermodesulfobacteriota bacterium]